MLVARVLSMECAVVQSNWRKRSSPGHLHLPEAPTSPSIALPAGFSAEHDSQFAAGGTATVLRQGLATLTSASIAATSRKAWQACWELECSECLCVWSFQHPQPWRSSCVTTENLRQPLPFPPWVCHWARLRPLALGLWEPNEETHTECSHSTVNSLSPSFSNAKPHSCTGSSFGPNVRIKECKENGCHRRRN